MRSAWREWVSLVAAAALAVFLGSVAAKAVWWWLLGAVIP